MIPMTPALRRAIDAFKAAYRASNEAHCALNVACAAFDTEMSPENVQIMETVQRRADAAREVLLNASHDVAYSVLLELGETEQLAPAAIAPANFGTLAGSAS